jgi:predicted outer membrane repeat protein
MGGGIYTSSGEVRIMNSSVVNNQADLGGGGIMSYWTALRVENTAISGNSSGINAGGIGCTASYGIPQISLLNCTLFSNTAVGKGGAYWGDMGYKRKGNMSCVNTTFANNTAGISGGAIYSGGDVILNHCSVVGNSCRNDLGDLSGDGGGIFDGGGTGYGGNGERIIALGNSIIAGNLAVTNPNIMGEIDTTCGANLLSGDPKLAPLARYGGSTATMPPLPGSPAIDTAVRLPDSPLTDQRGEPRPAGPYPDLGAIEAFPFSKLTLVDVDNDGFDDRLEPAYQMTVGVNEHGRDWDGDGSSDAEEIANMTDPFDSSSLLRITSFVPAPDFNPVTNPLFDVTFTCFPGLAYSFECDRDISFSSPSTRTTSFGTASSFAETVRIMLQPNRDFVRVRRDP